MIMLKIGCFPQDTKKTETCRHERKKKEGKRNCGRKREKRTCTTSSTTSPQTHLKSTPEVPHLHPTRLPARRFASAFFFFFFFFFLGFTPTWLNSHRTGLIRPKSSCIGHIGSYQPSADTAETCWKRPKSALNMAGKAETCLLLSFFCESRHSNVFFKNILIVKIYRKYK